MTPGLLTIAVDAMGGDLAPDAVVAGAVAAAREAGVTIALVGPAERLTGELAIHGSRDLARLRVVHAPDFVSMDESPLAALRRKPKASIRVAADLVARKEADALFSAGHTGATLIAAHAAFGLLPGVERPALAVTVPTRTGHAILLDAGANLECRPEHLVHFGLMGAAYARVALGIPNPRVGLLSIGEEAGKGNDLIREAHALLATARLAFIGNLEARDLFSGRADVIVCDGFTGNIALKVGEGVIDVVEHLLKEEFGRDVASGLGAWLARPAFRRFKRRVDPAEHGGAPLLGVNGLALVGHGSSSARAIESGIAATARLARARMVSRLAEALGDGSQVPA